MIKLTNPQLQEAIKDLLNKDNGLNDALQMIINSMMLIERDTILTNQPVEGNKANGFRYASALGFGKEIGLTIPRDRLGVFKPVLLTLIRNQEEKTRDLCFELYSKGLTTRQIGEIFENIYGTNYSKSTISEINKGFYEAMEQWRERPLEAYYPIIYIDAIHVKIRRETVSSEAFYVILGVKEDTTREIIGIINIPTESAYGWNEIFKKIKSRGVKTIGLVVADGLIGLENSVLQQFPQAKFQKCVVHFIRNILNKIKPAHKAEVAEELKVIFDVRNPNSTYQESQSRLITFVEKWSRLYPGLKKYQEQNAMIFYFTYLQFDWKIRSMIYTTNWIERLNKDFRRTLKIRNAMPSFESALTLMSQVALDKGEKHYCYPIPLLKIETTLFRY